MNQKEILKKLLPTLLIFLIMGYASAQESDDLDSLENLDEIKEDKDVKWDKTRADKIAPTVKKGRRDIKIKGILEQKNPTFKEIWEIEAGLHVAPIIPLDNLQKFFGVGFGGSLFTSVNLPFLYNSRIGASIGYANMTSDISYFQASVTLIPLVAYYELFYIFSTNIRPYLRLGIGGTYSSYKGKPISEQSYNQVSSFDATMDLGLGLGYRSKFLPMLEFILYGNYFRSFEKSSNSFLMVSLGTNIIF